MQDLDTIDLKAARPILSIFSYTFYKKNFLGFHILTHTVVHRIGILTKKNMVASSLLLIFVPWTILNRFGPGAIFLTFGIFLNWP